MIRKYIIVADDSLNGFDEEISKLEREWGAQEIEPSEDCISKAQALHACCDEWNKDYKAIMKSIRQLPSVRPQQTRWIPVSERLPQDEQKVLVTTRSGKFIDVTTSIYHHASAYWKHYVIAWMPLPEPYKAESEV